MNLFGELSISDPGFRYELYIMGIKEWIPASFAKSFVIFTIFMELLHSAREHLYNYGIIQIIYLQQKYFILLIFCKESFSWWYRQLDLRGNAH